MNALAPRLGQLVRLLGSESDGERLGALHAIDRTLAAHDLDWHALADGLVRGLELHLVASAIKRESAALWWQVQARDCLLRGSGRLKPIEQDFVQNMAGWPDEPTEKQRRWLSAISSALRCAA